MKKSIGEIIKYLRQSNNLSQKDIADALNMSISAISQYETGKRSLSVNEINLFADYFNVSTDYLLGREEINTGDLLEKKLKLSYEITLTHKEHSPIIEKVMMLLFYISTIVLLFFPTSKFLFWFAIITQFSFIVYMISRQFVGGNNYKKTFTIPDDVSVYYEYKNSNYEFSRLDQIRKVILFLMVGVSIAIIVLSIKIFAMDEIKNNYILLLLLTYTNNLSVFIEAIYSIKKITFYKKIDYFKFSNYLKRTLSQFLAITSYLLLIIFLLIFLQNGINTTMVIIFGLFLVANQLLAYIYASFLKYVLNSYTLKAMLNDTLEVKELS